MNKAAAMKKKGAPTKQGVSTFPQNCLFVQRFSSILSPSRSAFLNSEFSFRRSSLI